MGGGIARDRDRALRRTAARGSSGPRDESIPLVNHDLVSTEPAVTRPGTPAGVGPQVPAYLLDMIAAFVTTPAKAKPRPPARRARN